MSYKRFLIYFRILTLRNVNHPLGLIGLLAMYLSGLMILFLLTIEILGFHVSPYMGLVTFVLLPACFAGGAFLVFIGRLLARKRVDAEGKRPLYPFPRLDLNSPRDRTKFVMMIGVMTIILTVAATLSYQGMEFMESVTFCGKTCHSVMEPEYVAYTNSPHSRVACVECHIGPGAGWFVKSKLSGIRQVWAVATDDFSRPIETPIHNLRPARETCEQCHWPEKFHGDDIFVRSHFQPDEENTELVNALILKVGGGNVESGFAEGIHWHMNIQNKIEFISSDDREVIFWIRSTNPDGVVHEYVKDGFDMPEDFLETQEIRRMDCMDCHNRPSHTFRMPGPALDEAIAENRISREIPFIKREALKAITVEYASHDEAKVGIAASLESFYDQEYETGDWAEKPEFRKALRAILDIYLQNVFPEVNITWGTYPNHIGHEETEGCFRCHDEEHTSKSGKTISQDCDTCHTLLAWEERDPEILRELFP